MDGADIGMIEFRCRLRFSDLTSASELVSFKIRRQKFDGNLAVKPSVFGKINFTHPARAEQRLDLVRADNLTDQQLRLIVREQISGSFERRNFQNILGLLLMRDQGLHLLS